MTGDDAFDTAGAGLREGAELSLDVRDGAAGVVGGLRLGPTGAGVGSGTFGGAAAGSSGGFVFGGSTGLVSSGSV
jgi:hypothetical protein